MASPETLSERRQSDASLRKDKLGKTDNALPQVLQDHDLETASQEELPQGRQVGITSAIFLMVNRMLGTGVFSTTSTILAQGGSVGISLIYWVVGGVIAGIGFAVYSEFATALPRNGGELNYVSYVFRKPKFLTASMYAAQAVLLGQAAGNANAAGQYFMRAGGDNHTEEWKTKGIGVVILGVTFIMHSCFMKYGLWAQNALGTFKVVILLLIVFAGFGALAGHHKGSNPHNFDNAFSGTKHDVYFVSSCIYNVSVFFQLLRTSLTLYRRSGVMLVTQTCSMRLVRCGTRNAPS